MIVLKNLHLNRWFGDKNKFERIWLLGKIEFKLRYYENKLGLLWALIKPITSILMYYIAFNVVIKQDIPAFISYLFIGLIVWNFFLESTSGTIQILRTKKFLYEYNNLYKIDIYVSTLIANSIGFFFNFLMFLVYFVFLEKHRIGFSEVNFLLYLNLLPLFLTLFVVTLGISMVLSSLYVFANDINQIWAVLSGFMFFLSPIVFKLESYQAKLPGMSELNPMAGIIINFRNVLMYNKPLDMNLFWIDCSYAVLFLVLGLISLDRLGNKAAEKL
jgi:ABC-type polysaccharide/polyol phosphate export permease